MGARNLGEKGDFEIVPGKNNLRATKTEEDRRSKLSLANLATSFSISGSGSYFVIAKALCAE